LTTDLGLGIEKVATDRSDKTRYEENKADFAAEMAAVGVDLDVHGASGNILTFSRG